MAKQDQDKRPDRTEEIRKKILKEVHKELQLFAGKTEISRADILYLRDFMKRKTTDYFYARIKQEMDL